MRYLLIQVSKVKVSILLSDELDRKSIETSIQNLNLKISVLSKVLRPSESLEV